jgi:hypothetical protein
VKIRPPSFSKGRRGGFLAFRKTPSSVKNFPLSRSFVTVRNAPFYGPWVSNFFTFLDRFSIEDVDGYISILFLYFLFNEIVLT